MSELIVRLNGALPAFQKEAGCLCNRCRSIPTWELVNTSASIIFKEEKEEGDSTRHYLVDIGFGVYNSLLGFDGPWPIDGIFLTHGHHDHTLELFLLAMSLPRAAARGHIQLLGNIPVYCTEDTFNSPSVQVVDWTFNPQYKGILDWQAINPGESQYLTTGSSALLSVTPLPVCHWKDSVVFVVELWHNCLEVKNPPDFKVVLAWDLLCFIGPNMPNPWPFHGPAKPTHSYKKEWSEDSNLLKKADVVFIESNTWNACNAPHIPFKGGNWPLAGNRSIPILGAEDLLLKWEPELAVLVHYSGHEDHGVPVSPIYPNTGPVSNNALQSAARNGYPGKLDIGYRGYEVYHSW